MQMVVIQCVLAVLLFSACSFLALKTDSCAVRVFCLSVMVYINIFMFDLLYVVSEYKSVT